MSQSNIQLPVRSRAATSEQESQQPLFPNTAASDYPTSQGNTFPPKANQRGNKKGFKSNRGRPRPKADNQEDKPGSQKQPANEAQSPRKDNATGDQEVSKESPRKPKRRHPPPPWKRRSIGGPPPAVAPAPAPAPAPAATIHQEPLANASSQLISVSVVAEPSAIPNSTDPTLYVPEPPPETIQFSQDYLSKLGELRLSEKELLKQGYQVGQYSRAELNGKSRCENCGKYVTEKGYKTYVDKQRKMRELVRAGKDPAGDDKSKKKIWRCRFHNGQLINRTWTCCQKPPPGNPCCGNEEHIPKDYRDGELESYWRFYGTPVPELDQKQAYHAAVALDCEMGTSTEGENELIRLTMVDYFTGDSLIDSLVLPDVPMQHYNTRFSGVTRADMLRAKRKGTCIRGVANARREIFKFVSPDTIVVGHSANNDLKSLRWMHMNVVDTFTLEPSEIQFDHQKKNENAEEETKPSPIPKAEEKDKEADGKGKAGNEKPKPRRNKGSGARSLKTLSRLKLGRDIQDSSKVGHDSLEDAIASRDLAHWAVANWGLELRIKDGKVVGVKRNGVLLAGIWGDEPKPVEEEEKEKVDLEETAPETPGQD